MFLNLALGQAISSLRPRTKRVQVSQPCDWCRVHRTKCDKSRPCRNCAARGAPWGRKQSAEVRSLPQAFKEIQRLTQRVRELELELARHDARTDILPGSETLLSAATPAESIAEPVAPSTPFSSPSKAEVREHDGDQPKRLWEGVFASTTFSFPKQVRATSREYVPDPGTQRLDGSRQAQGGDAWPGMAPAGYLSASQEEYFLGVFWQSHHCSLRIVDEASSRKASALVDILVALCMQYDMAFLHPRHPHDQQRSARDVGVNDDSLAGWSHYRRFRVMLESEMERPTISTLQGLVFSVIYLCCANFQNTAHHMLALAVRIGYTRGLHLEPPDDMPRSERELRDRLWWAVYTTETKTCMKLGRPWSHPEAPTPHTLPADDYELALRSGSYTACITVDGSTITWLAYTRQNARLVLAARNTYVSFFEQCACILGRLRKERRRLLKRHMVGPEGLNAWVRDLPAAMKTQRTEDGVPLSTDKSRLDIEMITPSWLQRQRLFLELLYHAFMINLHRPFITFPSSSSTPGLLTTTHATMAARHSIAITCIIHQVMSETDLLRGWHEAFQQQWNAAITMVGFLLASSPSSLSSPSSSSSSSSSSSFCTSAPALSFDAKSSVSGCRAALTRAIDVFEAFGRHFSVGTSAAHAVRSLLSKVGIVLDGADACEQQQRLTNPSPATPFYPDITSMTDEDVAAAVREMLAGTIDMMYSADSFQAMGDHYMGTEPWSSGFY
ncbi:hypothetical protein C7999DRAFT_41063 [Corynascus novoguineensis]|uniref:Xylanolytic transcriptional activator regulatory domain-containing protein n=1 Tax=Corynascus novoguineensis TaxID=1126955 RepID=A0AAN7CTL2_9PEZI|nr:hypothetical protein C7999DRAFT_41063 [Corynascus novoguineensis]